MTTAVAVRDGRDVVDTRTGEVIPVAATPFEMKDYLSTLDDSAIRQQQQLAAAYDKACTALIGPNDVQIEGGRSFKKKSAWRKLARHFSISTQVVGMERGSVGETFIATVTVRAIGPWGQSAEAVGACATDEAVGRRVITIADAVATAETRATNRAISNLIAMGEVSAEEMSKGDAPRTSSHKAAADKIMPFGKTKGKRLGDLDDADLASAVEWCRKTNAEKFKDLIAAMEEVAMGRAGATAEDFDPHSLDEDDGELGSLPF